MIKSGIGYGEGNKKERSMYHTPKKYVHEKYLEKEHKMLNKQAKSKALKKIKKDYVDPIEEHKHYAFEHNIR